MEGERCTVCIEGRNTGEGEGGSVVPGGEDNGFDVSRVEVG